MRLWAHIFILPILLSACVHSQNQIGRLPDRAQCIGILPFSAGPLGNNNIEFLSEFLALDLQQFGARGVLGPSEVRKMLSGIGERMPEANDLAWAKEMGERLGVDAIIFGSVVALPIRWSGKRDVGTQMHLSVDAYLLDMREGNIRWVYDATEELFDSDSLTRLSDQSTTMAKSLLGGRDVNASIGKENCWTKLVAAPKRMKADVPKEPESLAPMTEAQMRIMTTFDANERHTLGAEIFQGRSAVLSKEGIVAAQDVARVLKDRKGPTYVEVRAHIDGTDDGATDLGISRERAESLKAYLMSFGISGSRIEAVGAGSSQPLLPNINDRSRMMNRRTELIVVRRTR